jgi:urea transporter
MNGMIESAIAQGMFKLALAMVAIALARGTLLWFDRAIGYDFDKIMEEAEPNARIYYYASRLVGVCIVVGLAIS